MHRKVTIYISPDQVIHDRCTGISRLTPTHTNPIRSSDDAAFQTGFFPTASFDSALEDHPRTQTLPPLPRGSGARIPPAPSPIDLHLWVPMPDRCLQWSGRLEVHQGAGSPPVDGQRAPACAAFRHILSSPHYHRDPRAQLSNSPTTSKCNPETMEHQALSKLTRSNVQTLATVVEEAARCMQHAKRTAHEGAVFSSVHADHPEALKEDNPRTGETPLPSALWSNPLAIRKSPSHLNWTMTCALRQPQCCRRGPQVPPTLASALSRQTSLLDTGKASRTTVPLEMPAGIER